MRPEANVVVIATRNQGKVREFASWFERLGQTVRSLADFPDIPDIVEDGETFADNALIKARTVAEALGVKAMADDSGLCVDALGGAPGVYSARYAGEHASDADNNAKLLSELQSRGAAAGLQLAAGGKDAVALSPGGEEADGSAADGAPSSHPAGGAVSSAPLLLSPARFVCALALYDPADGSLVTAAGDCEGYVVAQARGAAGFGYDPLFYLPRFGKTLAELTVEQKNEISHRAAALRALYDRLKA